MALTSGQRLGAYEIVALIGQGGMGEVYRARDTKLKREVAIKVLPELFARDAERLARFRREAEVLASLNHPNIAAIYGLEESDGMIAIVMEVVEGPTLGEHLQAVTSGSSRTLRQTQQPTEVVSGFSRTEAGLPVDETLAIARQIADALEAAHDKGVVHRDLKPANVKITPEGKVKVLDFGLAKLADPVGAGLQTGPYSNTMSPTLSVQGTRAGVILGTAAYMSPEQARGKSVDRRADIWAFGCVLYELLTGRQCFDPGETVSDAIVAILTREPDWSALPANTPTHIRTLLRRCLQKDPQKRLPHIGLVRIELDEGPAAPAVPPERVVAAPTKGLLTSARVAWSAAALVLVAATALLAATYLRSVPQGAPAVRASILLPEGVVIAGNPSSRLALSPDGRMLAFTTAGRVGGVGVGQIWVQALDGDRAQPLVGTEGAAGYVAWSPDSRSLAFVNQGKLQRIEAAGGPVATLSNAAIGASLTWNQDDVILFTPAANAPLHRISASGGQSIAVTKLDPQQGDYAHGAPFFLPDGRHFLYMAIGSRNGGQGDARAVYVGSLDPSEAAKLVLDGGSTAKWAEGYLLFLREATLMAQPFDSERLELSGEAMPLAEGVAIGATRTGAFSVSTTGVLAYQSDSGVRSQLTWFDRAGREIGRVGDPGDYVSVEISPDGARAALSVLEPNGRSRDLWLYDLSRGFRTQFTFDPGDEAYPVWSPNGERLVFRSSRGGRGDLYQKVSSGVGSEDLLLADDLSKFAYSWSPDGRLVSYNSSVGTPTGSDMWVLPLTGERKAMVLLQTPFNEGQARISPDGRWIAYVSNEFTRPDVFVTTFPRARGKWRVSTAGGGWPRWRKDGNELFFLSPDNVLMATTVNGRGPAFEVGPVRSLFETRARTAQAGGGNYSSYEVSSDGQRFLVNTFVENPSTSPITVVVNWTASLRK